MPRVCRATAHSHFWRKQLWGWKRCPRACPARGKTLSTGARAPAPNPLLKPRAEPAIGNWPLSTAVLVTPFFAEINRLRRELRALSRSLSLTRLENEADSGWTGRSRVTREI